MGGNYDDTAFMYGFHCLEAHMFILTALVTILSIWIAVQKI